MYPMLSCLTLNQIKVNKKASIIARIYTCFFINYFIGLSSGTLTLVPTKTLLPSSPRLSLL